MKILPLAAGIALAACHCAAFAQSDIPCGQAFEAPLQSSSVLTIDSHPAGIEIVGTDEEKIHLSCTAENKEVAAQIHLRLSGNPSRSKLTITGPHFKSDNNLHIRIEVPRKTNLSVDMPAGQVTVNEIVGNKEISLYAGQITISSDHRWNYKTVNASVGIGQVNAQVYDTDKGGFFRSFHKENPDGEYQLRAHVATGQIDLLGKRSTTSTTPQ